VLRFAPATYYEATSRPPSARELREGELNPQIQRISKENFQQYGADKVWAQLGSELLAVAHSTVERRMRDLGLRGVVGVRRLRMNIGTDGADRPADLVDRHFAGGGPEPAVGCRPDACEDHYGGVYVALIVDVVSRYVVGW
jgi:putative transposase